MVSSRCDGDSIFDLYEPAAGAGNSSSGVGSGVGGGGVGSGVGDGVGDGGGGGGIGSGGIGGGGGGVGGVSGGSGGSDSATLVSGESPPYVNGSIPVQDDDPGGSKWIHRDKLAQIEGNEVTDYLYHVGQSRWIHKDKLERIEIEELQHPSDLEGMHPQPSTLHEGGGGGAGVGVGGGVGGGGGEIGRASCRERV